MMKGLVIAGGESRRMGFDKSRIIYREHEIRYELYHLLKSFCNEVYISCNADQSSEINPGYNYLIDDPSYQNLGPMSALLTAFKKDLVSDWMVLGCDYPLINKSVIEELLATPDSGKQATIYFNSKQNIIEPLLGIYKSTFAEILFMEHKEGEQSLRRIHQKYQSQLIQSDAAFLQSIDTPDQVHQIIKQIISHE